MTRNKDVADDQGRAVKLHPTQPLDQGRTPQPVEPLSGGIVTEGRLRPHAVLRPDALLALQRTGGNQAVQRLIGVQRQQRTVRNDQPTHQSDPLLSPTIAGPSGMRIQRDTIEDFATYEQAKNANAYSKQHLDDQKDDKIVAHLAASFKPEQATKIYATNRAKHKDNQIHSDGEDRRVLVQQDTAVTPHIDHRFPKSQGGTNSFANARVMAASNNIKKSNKRELDEEPKEPLPPYQNLNDEDYTIGMVRDFSAGQKAAIYTANKAYYASEGVDGADGTTIISDEDEATLLTGFDSALVPNIDHITAKSEGGSNYYFNAQVLPADVNIRKSGRRGGDDDSDYRTGQYTLTEYYKKKQAGTLGDAEFEDDYASDEEEQATKRSTKRRK